MPAIAIPKYFIRLSVLSLVSALISISTLLMPRIAHAGGTVTNCTSDADLHAKLAGGGVVTFNCGPTPITITLTTIDGFGSYINITKTTSISGGGLITLQGDGNARIFNVTAPTNLTLDGLTVSNGYALDPLDLEATGGALRITQGGVVTVTNSMFRDNQARFLGGAIYVNNSLLTVKNSSLFNNQARFGGAIYASKDMNPGTLPKATIMNSTIVSNTATDGDGGGIRSADAAITVVNSTLSNNRAIEVPGERVGGDGGAIGITAVVTPANTVALITNTTIFNNFASINGGGIHIDPSSGSSNVKNTIIASNVASTANVANCSSSSITSNGNNIDSGNGCNFSANGDLVNTDPLLGPLANNGGNTLTHAPLPSSPAINTADNNACTVIPVNNVDQRGVPRPQGEACDIGAVEATANLSLVKSSTNEGGDPVQLGERITYTISITNSGSLTATGALISDPLPANTTFVPGSITLDPPDAGLVGPAPPTLASNLTITASQSVTLTYAVIVNSPLPNKTVITNTATITSTEVPIPIPAIVTNTVTSQIPGTVYLPLIMKNP